MNKKTPKQRTDQFLLDISAAKKKHGCTINAIPRFVPLGNGIFGIKVGVTVITNEQIKKSN